MKVSKKTFYSNNISSLPESYNNLISALQCRAEKDLTLGLVKGKLVDEYQRKAQNVDRNEKALKMRTSGRQKMGHGNS